MKADILTIFPGFFHGPLDHGITRRACVRNLITTQVVPVSIRGLWKQLG